jgi:hypothetical protein
MMKAMLLLILTAVSLVSVEVAIAATAGEGPDQILRTLKNTFGKAYQPVGGQYAVLYIHKGDPKVKPAAVYDVSNVCGVPPKSNFIKETIDNWSRGKGKDVYSVTVPDSPLWPTSLSVGPTLAKNCESTRDFTLYPNVATAGRIKTPRPPNPSNKFHSEYLLKKASGQMMLSYTYKERECPGAIFLYTLLTPCNSCKDIVKKIVQDIRTSKAQGKYCTYTPFYLGYTNEYEKWKTIEADLKKAGITILGPIL